MHCINNLSAAELNTILFLDDISQLKDQLHLDDARLDIFIAELESMPSIKNIKKTQHIIFPATLNTAATPIYFLWDVTYLCSLSTALLISLCFACAIFSVGIGIVCYIDRYRNQKQSQKTIQQYQLAMLKLSVLDRLEMINREQEGERKFEEKMKSQDMVRASIVVQVSFLKKCKLIGAGLVNVSLPLFGLGYLGTVSILDALGFITMASATGPIGFLIALSVSLLVGSYFGYKKYQNYKATKEITMLTKQVNREVFHKQSKLERKNLCREVAQELRLHTPRRSIGQVKMHGESKKSVSIVLNANAFYHHRVDQAASLGLDQGIKRERSLSL